MEGYPSPPRHGSYRGLQESPSRRYPLVGKEFSTRKSALRLLRGVGWGVSGKVYEARDLNTDEHVAVKVCDLQSDPEKQQAAECEWKIALKLSHANVLALREVHISNERVFMIMDLCSGGELFDRVARSGGLSEDLARQYFQQIVEGLKYCHGQQVWHRDLKLENMVMADSSVESCVKIADFGLSKDGTATNNSDTSCGTVSYMAPEICMHEPGDSYDAAKADIWALGVILYVMRCCAYPFGHDGRGGERADVIFARTMRRRWKNPGQLEEKCSPLLQDLINSMLTVEPEQRATVEDIMNHPWFCMGTVYVPPKVERRKCFGSPKSPHWSWPAAQAQQGWVVPPFSLDGCSLEPNDASAFTSAVRSPARGSMMRAAVAAPEPDSARLFILDVSLENLLDAELNQAFQDASVRMCRVTASTVEQLQTRLAEQLGLPDELRVWYVDPALGAPALIVELLMLPCRASVTIRRGRERGGSRGGLRGSSPSAKQGPITKRLRKELADMARHAPASAKAMPISDDMLKWRAVVHGAAGSCWEGGLFHFNIDFPQGYPFKPFRMWLETQMYHPNVSAERGGPCSEDEFVQNFCADMLSKWSPAHTVRKVLAEVERVIHEPNLERALAAEAALEFSNKRSEFEAHVRSGLCPGGPSAGGDTAVGDTSQEEEAHLEPERERQPEGDGEASAEEDSAEEDGGVLESEPQAEWETATIGALLEAATMGRESTGR